MSPSTIEREKIVSKEVIVDEHRSEAFFLLRFRGWEDVLRWSPLEEVNTMET